MSGHSWIVVAACCGTLLVVVGGRTQWVRHAKQLIDLWNHVIYSVTLDSDEMARGFSVRARRPAPPTAPLRVHPLNSRYFTDDGVRPIWLGGSHTWDDGQDVGRAAFDYQDYIASLTRWNHNFVRLWVWEQPKGLTTNPAPLEPVGTVAPEIFARSAVCCAADGEMKFDLTKYNRLFLDRLRSRVVSAAKANIYVSIMLFNGWSVEQKGGGSNPWPYHPFNRANNVNGVDGDANGDDSGRETHTLEIRKVTALQEGYVKTIVDTVNDLNNVLFEISNESNGESISWQYHMIRFVKSYEATLPKQHPVGMTFTWFDDVPDSDGVLFRSEADWISPGTSYSSPPPATGEKVLLSDTDHIWGIGGDRDWAWKSFTRGANVLYMDPWQRSVVNEAPNLSLRLNIGYILSYSERVDLVRMRPTPELCSSSYCLTDFEGPSPECLVYLPAGHIAMNLFRRLGVNRDPPIYLPGDEKVTVDLTGSAGLFHVEWFDPESGKAFDGGTIRGGGKRSLSAPFRNDAALYLFAAGS